MVLIQLCPKCGPPKRFCSAPDHKSRMVKNLAKKIPSIVWFSSIKQLIEGNISCFPLETSIVSRGNVRHPGLLVKVKLFEQYNRIFIDNSRKQPLPMWHTLIPLSSIEVSVCLFLAFYALILCFQLLFKKMNYSKDNLKNVRTFC